MARAIFLGPLQSDVPYVVHRLRQIPTAIVNGHVAYDAQYDQRGYLLRPIPRTRDESHSVSRFLEKAVPRKGNLGVTLIEEIRIERLDDNT